MCVCVCVSSAGVIVGFGLLPLGATWGEARQLPCWTLICKLMPSVLTRVLTRAETISQLMGHRGAV